MANLKGLSFPLKINKRGGFGVSTGVEKIKDNLKALILTGLGERVMNPSVGSMGYAHLFNNLGYSELSILKHRIRTGIEAGESRVTVLDLDIQQPNQEGELLIHMTFRIDSSNEFEDLTFYL